MEPHSSLCSSKISPGDKISPGAQPEAENMRIKHASNRQLQNQSQSRVVSRQMFAGRYETTRSCSRRLGRIARPDGLELPGS